jgi:hypothetical protein
VNARPAVAAAVAALLAACGDKPPAWDVLLERKIQQQFPAYTVSHSAGGDLLVARPGLPTATVEVAPIAQFCQRGPKDCNYATDRMLIDLQGLAR